jgi:hypothetical protein
MIETPWTTLRPLIEGDLTADFEAGNHFAVIAPTGQGKTTITVKGIIPMFNDKLDVLIIDSTADPKLSNYGKPYQKYGKINGVRRLTVNDLSPTSARKIHGALGRAYKQGECLVIFDEVRHICDKKYLGLSASAESLWLFSRKRRNIVGGLTQAPRYVPSAFYDQSKLHFIFKIRDRRAMIRLAEIGGDYDTLKTIVPTLGQYEFAYINPSGDVTTSKFDLPKAKVKGEANPPRIRLTPDEPERTIRLRRAH